MNTAKAWGYLLYDRRGKYTLLANAAYHWKPYLANPHVRVRILREEDYQGLKNAIASLRSRINGIGEREE